MEQKRSIGVTRFGISFLFYAIICNILQIPTYRQYYHSLKPIILMFFVSLIFSIYIMVGILKLKKSVRYLVIMITFFGIIAGIYSLIQKFLSIPARETMNFPTSIIVLCYSIALGYFFTRPKVKEQFK